MTGERDSTTLRDIIAAAQIPAELVRPGESMPTVADAARALGVDRGVIVKTVVFQEKAGLRRCCAAVVLGDDRVDAGKLARALNLRRLALATPASTLAATGYAAGGVPPIGLPAALPVAVDAEVLSRSMVFAGAGDSAHMLRIASSDIVRLGRATVVQIAAGRV
jgi:Cys-tRNA(Pro) deacylase